MKKGQCGRKTCISKFLTVFCVCLLLIVPFGSINAFAAPQGMYDTNVKINGHTRLRGSVYSDDDTTYVPMRAFANWLGVFQYSYNYSTKTDTLTGINLTVRATVGKQYIEANGRYFNTVKPVKLIGGNVYVPIRPLVKALNCHIEWDGSQFLVRSGDTSRLRNASQVYDSASVYWLSRIIEAEAGAEPFNGKLGVGNVVLNRTRSPYFPNSIYGVIFDRKYGVQFSPIANGTIYNTPSEEAIIAAKVCLEGYSLSSDVLYFLNPSISSSSWIMQNRQFAFRVGKHSFYY